MSNNYNYAASVAALRIAGDRVMIGHSPVVFMADDEAGAKTIADTIALSAYPIEDGWNEHRAEVMPITGVYTGEVRTITVDDETFGVVTPAEDDPT